MQQESSLAGQTVMVTGASSGIGRAVARHFAASGARIVAHYRHNQTGISELRDEITAAGGACQSLCFDLAESDQQVSLVDAAFNAFGVIHCWVHCAGADVLTGEAANWSFTQKLEQLWRVDVAALIRVARLVCQRMAKQQLGDGACSFITIGWDQAESGMGGDAGQMFGPTKAAVMAFTRSLAQNAAPSVRVNCVAPGWIRTKWGKAASAYWRKRAIDQALLGRWGEPEDVAQVVRFLASPEASFIAGHVVPVNGGFRSYPTPPEST